MNRIVTTLSSFAVAAAIAAAACGPADEAADGEIVLPDVRATVAAVTAPTPTPTLTPTPTRKPLGIRPDPTLNIRVTVDPTEVAFPVAPRAPHHPDDRPRQPTGVYFPR